MPPDHVAAYPASPPDPYAEAPADNKAVPPGLLAQALQIPLRRWPLSLACVLISAVIAAIVGMMVREELYEVTGVLLYRPPGGGQSELSELYRPPSTETLVGTIDSPQDMNILVEKFHLKMTAEALGKQIKYEQNPPRSQRVEVKLKWGDAKEGAAIVNELMELHSKRVRDSLEPLQKDSLRTVEGRRKDAEEKLEIANREFETFLTQRGIIGDLDTFKKDLDTKIANAERELLDGQSKIRGLESQVRAADDRIAELEKMIREKSLQELEEAAKRDGQYEKERRDLTDKLTAEQNARAETKPQADSAAANFAIDDKLFRMKIVAEEKWRESKAKRDQLAAKLEGHDNKIAKMTKDLNEFPRVYFKIRVQKYVDEREKARDELAAAMRNITTAQERVKLLREEKQKKLGDLNRGEGLQQEVQQLRKARTAAQNLEFQLKQLPDQVTIQSKAEPPPNATSSTFKKKAALTFAICFVVLMGAVIIRDLMATAATTSNVAARMALPVLSRFQLPDPSQRWAVNDRSRGNMETRSLALKLRQYLPETGGTILFSSLNPGVEVEDLISDLSRFLTLQDEQVLILDARIGQPQGQLGPPWLDPMSLKEPTLTGIVDVGLVQYLVFEGQSIWDKIQRTRMARADYLPAGGPCLATDVLASQQMRELIPELRKRYSVVLLVSPPLTSPIDVEILAGYVEGIVIVLNKPLNKGTDEAVAVVRNLKDLRAPLLGCVLCD